MKKEAIAFFAALDDEIRIIKSKMIVDEQVYFKPSSLARGQLNEKPCILIKSGIGQKAMRSAVNYCISNFNPSICINVGYAGGTTPMMNAGDMLIADFVVDNASGKTLSSDKELSSIAETLCKNNNLKVMRGGLVTVDEVIKTPHEKAFVGTSHDAMAIDMESFAFIEQCLAMGKPALVIRTILDPLDIAIPDMEDVVDAKGEVKVGQMAGHLVHHPRDIFSLPKIEYCAIKARESIATLIEAWVKDYEKNKS